jgi:hypothetical protein
VGLITPHRTNLTITKTCKGRPRPDPGCSATDDDEEIIKYDFRIAYNGMYITKFRQNLSNGSGFESYGQTDTPSPYVSTSCTSYKEGKIIGYSTPQGV